MLPPSPDLLDEDLVHMLWTVSAEVFPWSLLRLLRVLPLWEKLQRISCLERTFLKELGPEFLTDMTRFPKNLVLTLLKVYKVEHLSW
mmetsp:Transcript_17007/g.46121  ORF Transcript_17007/g.46121 Transcript_17007/m.46121 type:complete len:87 (-) Transcript_17007:427-687(-)